MTVRGRLPALSKQLLRPEGEFCPRPRTWRKWFTGSRCKTLLDACPLAFGASRCSSTRIVALKYGGASWRARRFNRSDPFFGDLHEPQSLHKYAYTNGDPILLGDPSGQFEGLLGVLGALAIQGLQRGIKGAAVGAAGGAAIGAIDAALAGENIIRGAIGGAKWGAAIGFGLGFLAPFATTFLAPPTISFLMNMGAGASIFFGSVGAAESFQEGHVAQGFFRLGMGFLGAAAMRYGATRPMKPVNIGGEGEVPEAINLQGRWALGRHFGRSQPTPKGEPAGQNLAGMLAEGHEFVIYNADTEVLPFTTDSVPRVYTNSVLIDAPMGIYRRILSSEIKRVLQSGGQWFVDGVLYFTKP